MVFFLTVSVFQEVSVFAAALEGGNSALVDGANQSTDNAAKEDINELKTDSRKKMVEIADDPGLSDYFSMFIYGAGVFLSIVASTLEYIVWFAPLLMKWGVPSAIAVMLQTVIYILYLLSLKDLFFGRRMQTN